LKVWFDLADFLKKRSIGLVENAAVCAEFVEGMMVNYKIE